jgi:hypothetical protein
MPRLRTLDPEFPIECQFAVDTTPVVLANVFTPDRAYEQDFLKVWVHDAAFMKRQPGFISAQLHRAIGDSRNRSELRGAVGDRCFPGGIQLSGVQSNPLLISHVRGGCPHRCQKVAVPDMCVA